MYIAREDDELRGGKEQPQEIRDQRRGGGRWMLVNVEEWRL